jgi:hypothetical protein
MAWRRFGISHVASHPTIDRALPIWRFSLSASITSTDPVELARQGEAALRARLAGLNLEQLKDVVADYGMDPGKLVLKWKTADRIIDRIVEVSIGRAKKGEGFLSSGSPRSE